MSIKKPTIYIQYVTKKKLVFDLVYIKGAASPGAGGSGVHGEGEGCHGAGGFPQMRRKGEGGGCTGLPDESEARKFRALLRLSCTFFCDFWGECWSVDSKKCYFYVTQKMTTKGDQNYKRRKINFYGVKTHLNCMIFINKHFQLQDFMSSNVDLKQKIPNFYLSCYVVQSKLDFTYFSVSGGK